MSALTVWLLLTAIPGIRGFCIFTIFIIIVYTGFKAAIWLEDARDPEIKSIKKTGLRSLISVIILAGVFNITPSKEEMVAIVAVPYVTDNAQFKQLPENVLKVLNGYIKKYTPKEEESE